MDKPINGMRIKGNLIETYLHGQFPRVIYIYIFLMFHFILECIQLISYLICRSANLGTLRY